MRPPLVSISCITYNHAAYIAECLDGFLMQQCDFDFEILIHDDASTDGTSDIIRAYQSRYPDIIKPIIQEENQWSKGIRGMNSYFNFPRAQGKYIALCEGDDYWTDPLKLQKQVDFLEANEEFSFCFHDAIHIIESTGEKTLRIGNKKIDEIVDLNSIIKKNNVPTASILHRIDAIPKTLPDWINKTSKGDYGYVILLAQKGLGKYFSETMSVYRIHDGGIWSSQPRLINVNDNIKFYDLLYDYFKSTELKRLIRFKQSKELQDKGLNILRNGQIIKGLYQLYKHYNFFADKEFKTPLRKILSATKTGFKALISQPSNNNQLDL